MARTRLTSVAETITVPRSLRFCLVVFLVRIWRRCEWVRLTLPFPKNLKRLAAPLLVFILGILYSLVDYSNQAIGHPIATSLGGFVGDDHHDQLPPLHFRIL